MLLSKGELCCFIDAHVAASQTMDFCLTWQLFLPLLLPYFKWTFGSDQFQIPNLSLKINFLYVIVFQGRCGARAGQEVVIAAGSGRKAAVGCFFDSEGLGESSSSCGYCVLWPSSRWRSGWLVLSILFVWCTWVSLRGIIMLLLRSSEVVILLSSISCMFKSGGWIRCCWCTANPCSDALIRCRFKLIRRVVC